MSGRVTPDGRPLLWKNRDTSAKNNEVRYFSDGAFRCVAVVNANQSSSVWMGVNEAGLCIENSVSGDLKGREGAKGHDNGDFMLRVLQNCATVGDVEMLLNETDNTGRSTKANFGVIDAAGGAVLFETSPSSFTKFDANDPAVAPHGYVVRSNFAFTARGVPTDAPEEKILGVYSAERYVRGCRLMEEGLRSEGLTPKYLLRNCCRDLADADCEPLPGSVNGPPGDLPEVIDTESTISRATTVSAAVFHGVKPGEDPLAATMWVLLGDPAFSVAVPCWVAAEGVAPELDGPETSDLCSASLVLRNSQYLKGRKAVRTDRLPEFWSAAWKAEDTILAEAEREVAGWRSGPPAPDAVSDLHDRLTREAYLTLYELTKTVEPEIPEQGPIVPVEASR